MKKTIKLFFVLVGISIGLFLLQKFVYSSTCSPECQPGFTCCTQRAQPYCADLMNDRENCGACGNECEGPIDGGCYCNQGECSNTPPYPGAPGCPSQSSTTTSSTSSSTTTSTSSSTTSSTSSSTTTTTTSIIPASLTCEKNEINVGETNNCTVSNCDTGIWVVVNKEGQPLSLNQIIITDLPPNQIQFGPTVGPGKIVTLAFCMSPAAVSLKHETIVSSAPTEDNFKVELRGDYDQSYENSTIYIEDDKIGDACSSDCSLCDWSQGLTKNIDTEDYCGDNKLEVRFLDSDSVNSDCNAKHKACVFKDNEWKCCERQCGSNGCENSVVFDCDTWQCIESNKFNIGAIDCDKDKCTLEIESNTLNQQLDIYVYLIEEPSGKIYYSGSDTIDSNFEGSKDISMDRITICPSGTKLNAVINVYDKDLNRVYNIKGEGFEC